MFYSIRHLTQFRYDSPVSESLMEVRMHPRTEGGQRCLSFQLTVDPRAQVNGYRDYLGNSVHHFDVPGQHKELAILAEALVEMRPPDSLPERLDADAWRELDMETAAGDYWEMLMPSHFARPSEALNILIRELRVERRDDPLTFLRELNTGIYEWFEYVPKATSVDSPIDHAIEARKGVCQDFAHIMTALARHVSIPCRYVSGYVLPRPKNGDRQARTSRTGATHAWVEALVPGYGWVGFDPTSWRASAIFARRSAATMPTCRRPRVCSKEARRASWLLLSASRLPTLRRRSRESCARLPNGSLLVRRLKRRWKRISTHSNSSSSNICSYAAFSRCENVSWPHPRASSCFTSCWRSWFARC
jgi:transglutaminase-like putative cysteine protease